MPKFCILISAFCITKIRCFRDHKKTNRARRNALILMAGNDSSMAKLKSRQFPITIPQSDQSKGMNCARPDCANSDLKTDIAGIKAPAEIAADTEKANNRLLTEIRRSSSRIRAIILLKSPSGGFIFEDFSFILCNYIYV